MRLWLSAASSEPRWWRLRCGSSSRSEFLRCVTGAGRDRDGDGSACPGASRGSRSGSSRRAWCRRESRPTLVLSAYCLGAFRGPMGCLRATRPNATRPGQEPAETCSIACVAQVMALRRIYPLEGRNDKAARVAATSSPVVADAWGGTGKSHRGRTSAFPPIRRSVFRSKRARCGVWLDARAFSPSPRVRRRRRSSSEPGLDTSLRRRRRCRPRPRPRTREKPAVQRPGTSSRLGEYPRLVRRKGRTRPSGHVCPNSEGRNHRRFEERRIIPM